VLISIRTNRVHLEDSSMVLLWPLTSTVGLLSITSIGYLTLITVTIWFRNPVFEAWNLSSQVKFIFGVFGIFYATLLFVILYSLASATDAYRTCSAALFGRGHARLMRTVKAHAWELQLIASTPEADLFRVSGIPVTLESVARLGYVGLLALGALVTQIGSVVK
jgi:hypothetical protein